jgi:hypothetical protein
MKKQNLNSKFYTKDKDLMKPKTSNSSRISFLILYVPNHPNETVKLTIELESNISLMLYLAFHAIFPCDLTNIISHSSLFSMKTHHFNKHI